VQVCGGSQALPTFLIVKVRDDKGALLANVPLVGKGGVGGGGGLLMGGDESKTPKGKGAKDGRSSAAAQLLSVADTLPLNAALHPPSQKVFFFGCIFFASCGSERKREEGEGLGSVREGGRGTAMAKEWGDVVEGEQSLTDE